MPQPITIPRLGWSMEEGVFGQWLKTAGDAICAGESLFMLDGEKATTEIESLESGFLCIPIDAPKPGTVVKVGEVIGFILAEGELAPQTVCHEPTKPVAKPFVAASAKTESGTADQSVSQALAESAPRVAGPAARRLARELGIDLSAVCTPDPTGRVRCEDVQQAANKRASSRLVGPYENRTIASPRAKRRAKELGVDWTQLAGTGRNGRIRERDVVAGTTASVAKIFSQVEDICPTEPGNFVPASQLRLIIARRMFAGIRQGAAVTITTKTNAEAMVAFREEFKANPTNQIVPSYNDMLIHWTALTLRELPELNACWYRDGIHFYDDIHIATAVDTPNGLLAPVVRHADRLSLPEITKRTRQLIAAARSGRLSQNELTGGTFTISNLGMFGIDSFTPILNLPQAGIVGIGQIVEEPVVRNGQIVIGKTITLSLTFDHRVIDGVPAARWLQRLGNLIYDSKSPNLP